MLKTQRLSLALALALGAPQVLALGLGAIDVKSGLNEPLRAEIPIVSSKPGEIESLQVRLASPEAFQRIGIDRPGILSANLEFAVDRNDRGQPVIRVTTPSKVRDPFLNFLLEVETGRGRLLREYTVLLDPPVVNPVRRSPTAAAPSAQPAAAQPAPVAAEPARPTPTPPSVPATPPAEPATAAPQPAPAPARQEPSRPTPSPAPRPSAADSITVARGQTLWSVAQQVRSDPAQDTNQIMLALQETNPGAFIDGNINRLKSGAVLRIPSREQIAAIDMQTAMVRVREQNEQWRGRPAPQPVGTERATAAARPVAPADSRLEVVPPNGDRRAQQAQSGAAAAEGTELRAELARNREQVSALEQENRELRSRVTDLEKIDRDTRRLIELKDSQLAEAQRRLAELEAAREAGAASAPAEAAPVAAPAADAAEPAAETDAAMDESAAEPMAAADAGVDEDGVTTTADAAADAEPATAAPVASTPPPAVAAPAEPGAPAQPWWRDPKIIGGAGALLVGLLALLALRGRKKPEEPKRASVADAYAAATAGAGAVSADQDDVEAAQEQQLLDVIAEQPDDLNRHLALVRHYYETGDASGFEGAAEAMYAQLYDPDDGAWKEVVAMGRQILPDHPLFAVTEADEASFAASLEAAQSADQDVIDEELPVAPAEVEPAAPAASREIDWDMALNEQAAATAAAEDEFLPEDQYAGSEAAEPESYDADATQTFSVDELERMAAQAEPADEAEPIGYDLAMDEAVPGETADEALDAAPAADEAAATKLELARAYLDMGDIEGARGMLEEVVNEGNPGQRSEAKRLLDEIR